MIVDKSTAATPDPPGVGLCLDFANTVSPHGGADVNEHLHAYADLLAWGRRAGVLTAEGERGLAAVAARRPAEAAAVLVGAIALREAIYRVFSAVAGGRAPAGADLATLNDALARASAHLRVVPAAGGFAWAWAGADDALDRVLWPVARSAADLLTSARLDRVRECAGEDCNWLFLDLSRNRSRRWCDMKECGNRAKARRHYRRKVEMRNEK
ncbi:MAG TPA: ABATE domain-containing protein [Thermomicrobiales bacterium]|nr:ABATE domain-containing protein [Thermomicrobiales bacterium]